MLHAVCHRGDARDTPPPPKRQTFKRWTTPNAGEARAAGPWATAGGDARFPGWGTTRRRLTNTDRRSLAPAPAILRRGGARGWSARWGLLSGRARTFIVSRFVTARVWDRGTVEDEPAACSGRGRCRRPRQLPRPAPLSPPLGDSAAFRWPKRPRGGGRRASPCVTGGTGRPSAPGRAGWDGRERGKQPGSRFWWWSHPSTAVRVCAQVRAGSHVCRTSHTRGP